MLVAVQGPCWLLARVMSCSACTWGTVGEPSLAQARKSEGPPAPAEAVKVGPPQPRIKVQGEVEAERSKNA
jgi:hypothetical protein